VRAALATANFPSAIESELGAACRVPCTVCHATNAGGSGTVTRAFGIAMKDRGLVGSDTAALADALAQMDADGVDSDGDGVLDTQALADGLDPNDGSGLCGALLPTYGCFGGGSAAAVALMAPLVARRRRRAR
jgi:hypothetical protein